MGFKALGVGLVLLTSSPASAETLCVLGDVYIEMGQIVPPSVVVARNVKKASDCPNGSVGFIQETEDRGSLTSTQIKRIRERNKEVAEKGEDRTRSFAFSLCRPNEPLLQGHIIYAERGGQRTVGR